MGPLSGLVVLDLSRVLAGPWATQLMADLGAEIIKVERPNLGDDTRGWGPPFLNGPDGAREAAYFLAANRGKKSICVDIATAEGQMVIRDLARKADVLVENFKVGDLQRRGLDYATLRPLNERIIYCSISGFGQSGPYAERPGYDFLIQALSGLMSVTGEPDGQPMKVGVALVDILTGLYACNGILAAVTERVRTGVGRHIEVSLLETMIAALANQALNVLVSGNNPARQGNAHPNIVPYDLFETAGRPIVIAVGNDAQFASLCAVLGAPALAADPAFSTNERRVANREQLRAILTARLAVGDATDWLAKLEAAGIPAGAVNTIQDALDDPHVRARGVEVRQTRGDLGAVPGIACPIRIDGAVQIAESAPPALGAATRDLLRDYLAMDDERFAALLNSGAIWARRQGE